MIGLRKNIAEENLGFADSSAAEPTAVGSETSTRPGFHDSTYITRNSLDTPPDDVEMLRKTMEGAKLSDSNDVLLQVHLFHTAADDMYQCHHMDREKIVTSVRRSVTN